MDEDISNYLAGTKGYKYRWNDLCGYKWYSGYVGLHNLSNIENFKLIKKTLLRLKEISKCN